MSSRWRETALTRMLGIDLPIVLGAFGGASSIALTAAVSNGGGLGSYGLYGYGRERILGTAAELRNATTRPFALNLWLPHRGPGEEEPGSAFSWDRFGAAAERLAPLFAEVGMTPPSEAPAAYLPAFDEQLDAVLEARPAVLSVVFGVPDAATVDACHARGIRVIGTATTVDEAVALARGGVDAVVASGMEAGGHRVSFLRPAEESLVGTFALVPQVVDAIDVPVIAAGGIADARGVAAALVLGASGAMIGTAFLATEQSGTSGAHRDALRSSAAAETVLTRAMSGRLARGIPNRATREITDPAPFPLQNWLTGLFRARAAELGRTDLLSLWAGQAASLVRERDASALLRDLAAGVDVLLPE
ncbi:NAD(P)H-dependent flavin oxidoreductase [Micromonospora sp. DT81.3]|uniref:NAD(P)H-dependent flavin oxidoreductase n=1 Tax=Micromonospora sp. DT81.3 TaxID=3416523 RepID=UPI003CFA8888